MYQQSVQERWQERQVSSLNRQSDVQPEMITPVDPIISHPGARRQPMDFQQSQPVPPTSRIDQMDGPLVLSLARTVHAGRTIPRWMVQNPINGRSTISP